MSKNLRALMLCGMVFLIFAVVGCFGGGGGGGGGTGNITPTSSSTSNDNLATLEGTIYQAIDTTTSDADTEDPKASATATPVKNALVSVAEQGISAYTDKNGEFTINDVWPGQRLVVISYQGQKASGTVTTEAGKTTVLTVELPASSGGGGGTSEDTGTLRIAVYGFYQGSEWMQVKNIRVWEYGNYSKRWYNSWSDNCDQSIYQLNCYNAPKNKYYVVNIEWENGDTRYIDTIYLYRDDQTEYIYHY